MSIHLPSDKKNDSYGQKKEEFVLMDAFMFKCLRAFEYKI